MIIHLLKKKINNQKFRKFFYEYIYEEENLLCQNLNLNRVSFNGAEPKFDIRSWSPDHSKMGKGVTLTNDEFKIILDAFRG